MLRIIALEREYGSGGAAIAGKLAERLGWKLWDQALTGEIASALHVDADAVQHREERCDTLFYRLAKVFMRGSFERGLPVTGLERFDADRLVEMMQELMEKAVSEGDCVIVGRGSPYFLRHRPDVLSVFIFAPLEEKIRRVKALGKSDAEAVELITSIDRDRATFVKKYYGMDWPTRSLYHLMINSKVGDETVVRMILDEMALLNHPPPPEKG
ncbi:MAG TPA: cytidylate kinase-like family protein [Terriglobia bacterium]|nr:cytidylate kinase-like family protein [Terriglobia bacterium]